MPLWASENRKHPEMNKTRIGQRRRRLLWELRSREASPRGLFKVAWRTAQLFPQRKGGVCSRDQDRPRARRKGGEVLREHRVRLFKSLVYVWE